MDVVDRTGGTAELLYQGGSYYIRIFNPNTKYESCEKLATRTQRTAEKYYNDFIFSTVDECVDFLPAAWAGGKIRLSNRTN